MGAFEIRDPGAGAGRGVSAGPRPELGRVRPLLMPGVCAPPGKPSQAGARGPAGRRPCRK